jgi:hypothetical protein
VSPGGQDILVVGDRRPGVGGQLLLFVFHEHAPFLVWFS